MFARRFLPCCEQRCGPLLFRHSRQRGILIQQQKEQARQPIPERRTKGITTTLEGAKPP
jgi:hypothetical protein